MIDAIAVELQRRVVDRGNRRAVIREAFRRCDPDDVGRVGRVARAAQQRDEDAVNRSVQGRTIGRHDAGLRASTTSRADGAIPGCEPLLLGQRRDK